MKKILKKIFFLNHSIPRAQGYAGIGWMFLIIFIYAILKGKVDDELPIVFLAAVGCFIWSFITEKVSS